MNNFFKALSNRTPITPDTLEYRLYYDKESGDPLFYSTEDKEGEYIIIDRLQYIASNYGCCIEKGKLVIKTPSNIFKLVHGTTGTECHKNDITLITKTNSQCWKFRLYEE